MAQVFQRDPETGTVINPPVDPDYERRMTAARDSGDAENVARVQAQYDDWRTAEVERIEGTTPEPAPATDATTAGPTPGAESDGPEPDRPITEEEMATGLAGLSPDERAKLRAALDAADNPTPAPSTPGGGAA